MRAVRRVGVALTFVTVGACSDSSAPVAVTPEVQIARGHDAFIASCATCHASRDAFDLAFFGFADSTIVRRAVKHVSAQTGRDIAAYVRSLQVASRGETFRPFQPAASSAESDGAFWGRLFNVSENDWPAGLTPAALRAIDMRKVVAPLPMVIWSDESDDDDWMPDVPLDPALLDANAGALRRLVNVYYATPSDAALLMTINAFRQLVRPATGGTDALCYGDAGAQPRAGACFQAMRWMSSLAAVHFLRRNRSEDIPLDVVHLWWETGEAAVSTNFVPKGKSPTVARTRRTAAWLYLAFTFAPMEFREENGYLGQFLQTAGLTRLALLAELRRMVGTGGVHDSDPAAPFWDAQPFWDGMLGVLRAPNVLKAPAALFVLDFLISSLDGGATFRPEARQLIDISLRLLDDEVAQTATVDPSLRNQIAARRAALGSRIPAAIRP
jgi:hypothetical protein